MASESFGKTELQFEWQKDPVCGVDVKDDSHNYVYHEKTYYFCTEECKDKFIENPDIYV